MRIPNATRRSGRLVASVAVVAATSLLLVVARYLGSPDEAALLVGEVRDEIVATRDSVETCTAAVAAEEARFRAHDRHVESLREVVRSFESADGERVPANQYGGYLTAFDSYNEAVREWHERADSLRARSDGCRALAEHHNVLVDSLQRLVGAGNGVAQ